MHSFYTLCLPLIFLPYLPIAFHCNLANLSPPLPASPPISPSPHTVRPRPRPTTHKQTMIVHNSSTLGRIDCHADAREDVDAMQAYWRLNATMPLAVNNVFFRLTADVRASFILNISSLCAVKAFKSWCCYSAG